MKDNATRDDAWVYVQTSLGNYAADYDIEAIVYEVSELLDTYDFEAMDRPDAIGLDVDYWDIVASHDISGKA